MSAGDLEHLLQRAFRIIWKSPPSKLSRGATAKPSEEPVVSPPAGSPVNTVEPDDIRSAAALGETTGAMITRSLPGLDVTLMVSPPKGDELWTVQGRIWLNPKTQTTVQVALVQDTNVLGVRSIADGGRFKFQDILVGEWKLEFHLSDDRVVVLRVPSF